MSDEYQHVWTAHVSYLCSETPRSVRFVSSWDFDKAYEAAKALLAKKFPNTFKDEPHYCHPDYALVGLVRGEELDNEEVSL